MTAARHRRSLPKWLVLVVFVFSVVSVMGMGLARVAAAAPPAHPDETTERAKELFQQGTTLFNVGEFDKAIEAWQQGYKEKSDPGFLYNIGQAYRLKGDNQKAIFFYRGYLRNSPKATNRADVEAKIAQLQKAASESKPATPAPTPVAPPPVAAPVAAKPVPAKPAPAPVPTPPPAPAPGPTAVAPPPVDAPPLAGPAAVAELPEPAAAPSAPAQNRPVDLAIGLGPDIWTSGLNIQGDAPAQLALALAGGYTFGGDVFRGVSFRLGAYFDTSTLHEHPRDVVTENKVTFTSLLLEPSVRVRLVDQRLYMTAGVGLGVLWVGGLKVNSVLIDPKQNVMLHSGAVPMFQARPSVGLQVHLAPRFIAFGSPALSFSPKQTGFYQALGRFELLFGVAILL